MGLFGGGKKKDGKSVPIEEIKSMASKGMSDKDIIKELKHRGFSYNEIEKAMLQAVKEGVSDEPSIPGGGFESFGAGSASPQEDLFGPNQGPQQDFGMSSLMEDQPEGQEEDTSALLEELIEGVIEEKWNKFEDRFNKVEESFERIKSEIRQFEVKVEQQKTDSPTKEVEMRLQDISQQMEELDARVGGLEKAFKQFLPSLTRNIESLSHLIHEMKEKGRVEVEEEV